MGNVHISGRYRETEVYAKLAAARCHVAFLPSIWPESYMYTLSIVMAAGLYTICYDLGAQSSRLKAWGWGSVIPVDAGPDLVNDTLLAAARQIAAGSSRAFATAPCPVCQHAPLLLRLFGRGTDQASRKTGARHVRQPGHDRTGCKGNKMHVFTSITANYLPKAAALAHSVKRVHPDAVFHVVLSDDMPDCPAATTAAFDSIINIRDLPIKNLNSWIFKHRLVELCTAVKGTAFQYIADRHRRGANLLF